MSNYIKTSLRGRTVEFKITPSSGRIDVGVNEWLIGSCATMSEAIDLAAERVRLLEHLIDRPEFPSRVINQLRDMVDRWPDENPQFSLAEVRWIAEGMREQANQ